MGYHKIGDYGASQMLYTKIHIYNHFPVNWINNWPKVVITNTEKNELENFSIVSLNQVTDNP